MVIEQCKYAGFEWRVRGLVRSSSGKCVSFVKNLGAFYCDVKTCNSFPEPRCAACMFVSDSHASV